MYERGLEFGTLTCFFLQNFPSIEGLVLLCFTNDGHMFTVYSNHLCFNCTSPMFNYTCTCIVALLGFKIANCVTFWYPHSLPYYKRYLSNRVHLLTFCLCWSSAYSARGRTLYHCCLVYVTSFHVHTETFFWRLNYILRIKWKTKNITLSE